VQQRWFANSQTTLFLQALPCFERILREIALGDRLQNPYLSLSLWNYPMSKCGLLTLKTGDRDDGQSTAVEPSSPVTARKRVAANLCA